MSRPIEFWFDFLSPYGYIGGMRIEELAAAYGRDVTWRPFLVGVTVMQIMGMKPLMETPLKQDYMGIDRPRLAQVMGVPFAIPEIDGESMNSLAAARAFYWIAESNPDTAREFAKRVLKYLWVDGQDISAAEDIAALAEPLGIEKAALLDAVASPEVKDKLRQATDEAISRSIFGAPFFIVDDQPIWGADRLWMVEHWLKYGNWDPPPKAA